jgi:DNA processing protein
MSAAPHLTDERLARACWSRLAEPGDVAAGAAVSALGAADALGHVLRGAPLPDSVAQLLEGRDPHGRLEQGLLRWRTRLEQLAPERDVRTVEDLGGRLLVPTDPDWPEGLDGLGLSAPHCLWVLGGREVAAVTAGAVAVVGSRTSSRYGEHVAGELAAGLADAGPTVVSGAAFGIDATAHRGALAAGGVTLAVLACGVDRFYPAAHESLLRRIAAEGLVVAEVAPGSMPARTRFLQRNRLIAALTAGTVVVEAGYRSGALSTAQHASKLGRRLMAVPGPVTSAVSAGCHLLLRDFEATCVTDASEVLELVRPIGAVLPDQPALPLAEHDGLNEQEMRVLDALPVRRGAALRSLTVVAGLPEPVVQAALGRLALRGLADTARRDGAIVWRRLRPAR